MSYVFSNIFWCLLAAGLLGGLIGWLIKHFGGIGKLAELESGWQGKFTSVEGERDRLAAGARESDDKLRSLQARISRAEGELSTLQSASIAWDALRSKQAADLKVFGEARLVLEEQLAKATGETDSWKRKAAECGKLAADLENRLQLAIAGENAEHEKQIIELKLQLDTATRQQVETESNWNSRYASLEGERSSLRNRLSSAHQNLDKAVADDLADDSAYEKRIAELEAKLTAADTARAELETGWKKRFGALESDRDSFKTQLTSFTGTSNEQIADLKRELALAEKRLDRAVADDVADDTAFQKEIADLKAQLAGTQQRLSKSEADDKADDAAYEKQINELKAQLAGANKQRAELESGWTTRFAALESQQASFTGASNEQIADLKRQLALAEERLGKAVADDKVDDAAYEKQINDLKAQTAAMVDAAEHEALKKKLAAAEAQPKKSAGGDIERIEGIGPVYGQKLRASGIAWVRELLVRGTDAEGRKQIVAQTGLKDELILKWVNAADLLRVDGVTPDWAELLEAAGVDTVKELRNRVPENLLQKLTETNPQGPGGRYAPTLPELEEVQSWVAQAKAMRPRVTH